VIGRATHIQEQGLLDCYLAERGDEPIDPRVGEHLADCSACAERYAELAQFMDGLRNEADDEAGEIFTTDHLIAQQRQIARRIEHVGRPARVISFPGASGRPADAAARRITPRWVAGAVAAGIFLGIGLSVTFRWDAPPVQPPLAGDLRIAEPARPTPVATDGTDAVTATDDDAFLTDLEIALEGPRTRELQPFDAITPRVVEINNVQ
jgi:anti-sigma factor RsiW